MFSRTIKRSILDSRIASPSSTSPLSLALPPTFLLPIQARYFNVTVQHGEPLPNALDGSQLSSTSFKDSAQPSFTPRVTRRSIPQPPSPPSTPLALSPSIKQLLPLLATQPAHYINIHIHGKPYLVTAGDSVRLPFYMPGVVPGDVLRLNRAASLGSREYTLKGAPYVDERIFECRATVVGTESEPMRSKAKTTRRNRRVTTIKSKHKYTILRISELKVKSLEDLEG